MLYARCEACVRGRASRDGDRVSLCRAAGRLRLSRAPGWGSGIAGCVCTCVRARVFWCSEH